MINYCCQENFRHFSLQRVKKKSFFLWIVATTTKICTRDYLMKDQSLHFYIVFILNLHVLLQKKKYIWKISFSLFSISCLSLAPSIFETFSFGRWVVTHSLCGYQLPWPPPSCQYENIFFMGSGLRQKLWHI